MSHDQWFWIRMFAVLMSSMILVGADRSVEAGHTGEWLQTVAFFFHGAVVAAALLHHKPKRVRRRGAEDD